MSEQFNSVKEVQLSPIYFEDQLEGLTLKQGEKIEVSWPNDCVTKEVVHIDAVPRTAGDVLATDHRAYVKKVVNGTKVRVYFRWKQDGTKIRRVMHFHVNNHNPFDLTEED